MKYARIHVYFQNFDLWRKTSSQQDVADYIEGLPGDSVVMLSVQGIGAAVGSDLKVFSKYQYKVLWMALNSIGLIKRFKIYGT